MYITIFLTLNVTFLIRNPNPENPRQTANDSEVLWLGLGNWVNQVPFYRVIKLGKLTWNLIHSVSQP